MNARFVIGMEIFLLLVAIAWDRRALNNVKNFERGPEDRLCRTTKRMIAVGTVLVILAWVCGIAALSGHLFTNGKVNYYLIMIMSIAPYIYCAIEMIRANTRMSELSGSDDVANEEE